MTIATLGLEVQSGQVKAGAVDLNHLEAAAKGAQQAAAGLAGQSRTTAVAIDQMNNVVDAEARFQERATASARMHASALQAEAAAAKMAGFQRRNLLFQLNDVGVSLASGMNPLMVLVQQGSQIATIYEGGVIPALKETGAMAGQVAAKFWPIAAAIGVAAAAAAGLAFEINRTAEVQVSALDVAQAAWELWAEQITGLVAPLFGSIGSWLMQGWDLAIPVVKFIGNSLIGTFIGAFDAIKIAWGALPGVMGEIAYSVANSVLDGIEFMLQRATDGINALIGLANNVPGVKISPLDAGGIDLGVGENPYSGAMTGLGQSVLGAAKNAIGVDYMGNAFAAISERAQQIAAARTEVEGLGGAAKAANDNFKTMAEDGMAEAVSYAEQFADAARSAFSNLGTGIIEAFKEGGNIAQNVLDMLIDRVGKLGETLFNNGLNGLLDWGINALMTSFGGFGIGSGLPGISSITGSSGGFFPGFAEGTSSAPGGLAWVGERGPELVNLPRGSQVIPHAQSMAMMAGGETPIYITNHINVPAGASADVAPAFAREVAKELRRQLPDALDRRERNPIRRAG